MNKQKNPNEETKEEFCLPCLAVVPLAFGIGGTASGSAAKNKQLKMGLMIGGIILTILSIILYIYFKNRCKTCR